MTVTWRICATPSRRFRGLSRTERALEIESLKLWIAKLQRMQFGRNKEKIDRQIEQLELRLEDLQADEGRTQPSH